MRAPDRAAEGPTSGSGGIFDGKAKRITLIVAIVEIDDASPSELRERFIEAVRDGIRRAWSAGRIVDLAHAEELWRALPPIESRK